MHSFLLRGWGETRFSISAILPDVLIDNFDVDRFEKTDTRFDIWLDEKKVQLREDKYNNSVIAYGFGKSADPKNPLTRKIR